MNLKCSTELLTLVLEDIFILSKLGLCQFEPKGHGWQDLGRELLRIAY